MRGWPWESVVLPLLLPRQGCRKHQKEQVMERASSCSGMFKIFGRTGALHTCPQACEFGPALALKAQAGDTETITLWGQWTKQYQWAEASFFA